MYYDLLIHVDDNDPKRLNLAFNNYANYIAAVDEEFHVVMVVNGPAVQLLKKENAEQAERGAKLMDSGLAIRVCNNALKAFGVDPAELWEGVEIVPAAIVEIVKLQREGFAYLRP
ncbi:DsrE family protein [Mailhella sp.]|uniref:DsrE family protein n=1 Tax=Mailhella sp. TaxID=1981029 RepID=UPI0040633343